MITEQELKAIELRADAATPGPWIAYPGAWLVRANDERMIADTIEYCGDNNTPNTDLIAHARADVPALIAEVKRLRAALLKIASDAYPVHDYIDVPPEVRGISKYAVSILDGGE